jgi:hypothetical protein
MDPNKSLFLGDDKVKGFCHELGVVGHGDEDDGLLRSVVLLKKGVRFAS